MSKICPLLQASYNYETNMPCDCMYNNCAYYDEHAQQCSQVSQATALRDIAEQLKRNADAMMDYSPAKEPVEVELQGISDPLKTCSSCKYKSLAAYAKPCNKCVGDHSNWQPK